MAAYNIHQHFKGLRVQTARRRNRDPFATGFEDDSDDDTFSSRQARSKATKSSHTIAPTSAGPAKSTTAQSHPTTTTAAANNTAALKSPPSSQLPARDSEDEFLDPPKRPGHRQPSPAPAALASVRLQEAAGRRGSIDRSIRSTKSTTNRAAVALAAGPLAYLDESTDDSDEDRPDLPPPSRSDRYPSPAPSQRKTSDPEPIRGKLVPPKHTVASPFAGTKYLQDSDTDEEAVASRQGSTDSTAEQLARPRSSSSEALQPIDSPNKHLEVKRVDKPKSHGSEVSWRAFSAGRAEQRAAEIHALQTSLSKRGWKISFATYAATDDGARVPLAKQTAKATGNGRGRQQQRRRSPPRRLDHGESLEQDAGDAEEGIDDAGEYKIDTIAALPVKPPSPRSDPFATSKRDSARSPIPDIRIDQIANGAG